MYNTYSGGCNILQLQISRHKTIDVKSNNTKSWDYTNPLLPMVERMANGGNPNEAAGQMSMQNAAAVAAAKLQQSQMSDHHPLLPMPMNMAAAAAAAPMSCKFVSPRGCGGSCCCRDKRSSACCCCAADNDTC